MRKLASILILIVGTYAVIAVCPSVSTKAPDSRPAIKIPADPPVDLTQQVGMPGVWKQAVFEVTAYCGCEKCCGTGSPGITASGNRVNGPVRHWVAAPARFPFGTCFRIPGYARGGVVTVLDRGGAIKGNKLDVFYPTHTAALEWGRRTLTIHYWKGTGQ